MEANWYTIKAGRLEVRATLDTWPTDGLAETEEIWIDVERADPEELRRFLAPLVPHPLILDRCVRSEHTPSVISHDQLLYLDFPMLSEGPRGETTYLSLILRSNVLLTIRHGVIPALTTLASDLLTENLPHSCHLLTILHLIISNSMDLTAQGLFNIRDQILQLVTTLTAGSGRVAASEITKLQRQVEALVTLTENQIYCILDLNKVEDLAVQGSDQKAYTQDLASRVEIAQRTAYRIEARMKDVNDYYQMSQNDRTEKRLRILTILSAVNLPLALITGMYGMNVATLPLAQQRWGFAVLLLVMILIAVGEIAYFKQHGWFD
jgi:magnesium transporter